MKEKVWESTVEADILNPAFLEQLTLGKTDMPQADEDFYYNLDIQFALVKRTFLKLIDDFPIVDRTNYQCRTPDDKLADIIGLQINDAALWFRDKGYFVNMTCIRGEAFLEQDQVIITLSKEGQKEYDETGKLKKSFLANSIMVSGPGVRENMLWYMSKERDRIAKEFVEKEEIERIPNMIAISSLFEAVAHGILSDKGANDDNQSIVLASKLAKCFAVESEHPLKMKGHLGENNWQDCSVKAVDCPEWMIYVEKAKRTWYLREQKSGRETQRLIESEWADARTGRVIVLHHLEVVPYSLMGNAGNGFIRISKAEASAFKQIQATWED